MDDFASAAMLRLVALGLQRQGLPGPPPAPAARGALVPLADKRTALAAIAQRHGLLALLRIGEAVQAARDEPALVALLQARDPRELVERWQRLERFIHSRHRVRVLHEGPGWLRLAHVSASAQPPTAQEDLLVLGVLVGLAQRLGAQELSATVDGVARFADGVWRLEAPAGADAALAAPTAPTAHWDLRWAQLPVAPTPAPAAAAPATTGGPWTACGHDALARDPSRRWTLERLAGELGLSARSLQRRLQAEGTRFSDLLVQARLARAAQLLVASGQPPAQVGYVCGFADQAHFTRAFKRHTALTPARFRERFGQARP